MYVCIYMSIQIYIYTYIYIYIYMCICMYIYVSIHIYLYIYMCAYLCISINTYIYACLNIHKIREWQQDPKTNQRCVVRKREVCVTARLVGCFLCYTCILIISNYLYFYVCICLFDAYVGEGEICVRAWFFLFMFDICMSYLYVCHIWTCMYTLYMYVFVCERKITAQQVCCSNDLCTEINV